VHTRAEVIGAMTGNEEMKEAIGLCDESMCNPMVHGIKLDVYR
jgi:hypothetical protein